ncbi:CPS-53 (KpLE1) prophage protein [Enterobacter intestinihominis]
MKLFEMEGFLRGKCIPRDLKVNETNAEYLVRKFAEADAMCAALAAEKEKFAVECAATKIAIAYLKSGRHDFTPNTPATEAFLAEVRAAAVDEVCLKISNAIVNCYQDEQVGLDAAATICGDFSAQLRKGVQS